MDSFCTTLKANVNPVKVSKKAQMNQDSVFWGESTRGSFENRDLSNKVLKTLKTERINRKIKPAVRCSVLTSDVNKEIVVSI